MDSFFDCDMNPLALAAANREAEACAEICSQLAAEARQKKQRGAELGALRCAHEIRIRLMQRRLSEKTNDQDKPPSGAQEEPR